jgi:hypothetical protein
MKALKLQLQKMAGESAKVGERGNNSFFISKDPKKLKKTCQCL